MELPYCTICLAIFCGDIPEMATDFRFGPELQWPLRPMPPLPANPPTPIPPSFKPLELHITKLR